MRTARAGNDIKRSSAPKVEREFHLTRADLNPEKCLVVDPGEDRCPLARDAEAIGLVALAALLQAKRR